MQAPYNKELALVSVGLHLGGEPNTVCTCSGKSRLGPGGQPMWCPYKRGHVDGTERD